MKLFKDAKAGRIALYSFVTVVISAFVVKVFIMDNDFSKYTRALTPFFYAFAIAYILNKAVNLFEKWFDKINARLESRNRKKIGMRFAKAVSIILAYILLGLLVYAFLSIAVPEVARSIQNLLGNYKRYMEAGAKLLDGLFDRFPILRETVYGERFAEDIEKLMEYISSFISEYTPKLLTVVEGLGDFAADIKDILLALFISVYMLIGKERFKAQSKKLIGAFCSEDAGKKILEIASESDKRFGGFIIGKLIDSLIVGIICYVCCLVFRFPYPELISFIVGITNIVPIVGPFLGAVPSAFLILLVDPQKALWFIVFIIVLQQLDGNFIGPKILGESTGLSSFWVLFALIVMGSLHGIVGMILAVPLFSVIYYEVKQFAEKRLEEKEKPVESIAYAEGRDVQYLEESERSRDRKNLPAGEKVKKLKAGIKEKREKKQQKDDSAK